MPAFNCPGQSRRNWKSEDAYEIPCPWCGRMVELFKIDVIRKCPFCRKTFKNPKLDLGCAEWCPYGDRCLESS